VAINCHFAAGWKPVSKNSTLQNDPLPATVQTASNGTYSFSGLLKGSYTVTPSMAGYTFTPSQGTVTITSKNITSENFSAIPLLSISGTVKAGSAFLSGVTITLGGAATGSATTGSDGSYAFTGLLKGSYTVTPSMTGYTFKPTNIKITLNNKNAAGQNFAATTLPRYSISGTVKVGSTPLPGVTVALSGTASGSVTTGPNGAYSFSGLLKGSYTVTPSMAGYRQEGPYNEQERHRPEFYRDEEVKEKSCG
jgi:inhibitor of cysteine peptidase